MTAVTSELMDEGSLTRYAMRQVFHEELGKMLVGVLERFELGGLKLDVGDERPSSVVALADEELVRGLWRLADLIPGEDARDHFSMLMAEALERWAPEAEWAVRMEEWVAGDDTPEEQRECVEKRRAEREAAKH